MITAKGTISHILHGSMKHHMLVLFYLNVPLISLRERLAFHDVGVHYYEIYKPKRLDAQ